MANIVSSGTVKVTRAQVTVTGSGTNFETALVTGGTLIVVGLSALIESVQDDTHLTRIMSWPGKTVGFQANGKKRGRG